MLMTMINHSMNAGICELDKSLKRLLEKLHIAIDQIANDEEVCINF